jgi:hypothetical protein
MLNDKIKNSLYKAVEKYQHERHYLKDCRQDIARIIAIAKKIGFVVENRSKYDTKEICFLYNGQWYLEFYTREDEIHAQINEYELLTGQALIDYTEQQEAESKAEIEAERRMSLYNSGYRDF